MNSLGILIPAAGKGERLGHEIPKPFIKIKDKSILWHTITRLLDFEPVAEVVVACPDSHLHSARQLLDEVSRQYSVRLTATKGGDSRQESVAKALEEIESTNLVAVHDAVRPFVSISHLRRCYQKACEVGAAILGVPVRDTIKVVKDDMSVEKTPDRNKLWAAQTPQIFRTSLLKQALRGAARNQVKGTDDASLLEYMGKKVYIVKGSQKNFKITFPEDLERAKQVLEGTA